MRRLRYQARRASAPDRKDRSAPASGTGALTGFGREGFFREWETEAALENLPRIRAFVRDACRAAGGDSRSCGDLSLAVDEACTNVIVHGYGSAPGGRIRLALRDTGGELTVTVEDTGRSFDPDAIRPPDLTSRWEDRPLGGLGWHLIRSSVDELRYDRGAGTQGNRLTLVKRIRASGHE